MQCYSASRANFIHFKADALHLSVGQIQVRGGEIELFFVFKPEKTVGGQLLRSDCLEFQAGNFDFFREKISSLSTLRVVIFARSG